MSKQTISEELFEKLCSSQGISCVRIPETSKKTADYRLSFDAITLIAEIKQLDPNDKDRERAKLCGSAESPGSVAPSNRVKALIEEGYPQVKNSSEGNHPTMIVVFNNSGHWNWIDTFTVSKAMFGSFGIILGLQNQSIQVRGQGYLGNRKVTKNTCRALSVVGVMKQGHEGLLSLHCYHNPFAKIQIEPSALARLAETQYIHPNPHDRGFISWEPEKIAT